jgi:hypothetical protein
MLLLVQHSPHHLHAHHRHAPLPWLSKRGARYSWSSNGLPPSTDKVVDSTRHPGGLIGKRGESNSEFQNLQTHRSGDSSMCSLTFSLTVHADALLSSWRNEAFQALPWMQWKEPRLHSASSLLPLPNGANDDTSTKDRRRRQQLTQAGAEGVGSETAGNKGDRGVAGESRLLKYSLLQGAIIDASTPDTSQLRSNQR